MMPRLVSLLGLVLLVLGVQAQELAVPIEQGQQRPSPAKKTNPVRLSLPFFDDFSYPSGSVDTQRWLPSPTWVNDSYARNPLTVGVASFDCLDAQGALHPKLDYFGTFGADTLCSLPIDLSQAKGVYLSFAYQGGGYGPIPGAADTLVLQFYLADERRWESVWKAPGQSHDEFQMAYIRLGQARYYTADFQFRFINYVSLGSDDSPSLRGNTDVWHIDLVYLDANRSDGQLGLDDIGLRQSTGSMLRTYHSVPWTHYLANPTQLMSDQLPVAILNYGTRPKNINELNFRFTDLWGTAGTQTIRAGSYDLMPGERFERVFPNNNYYFNSDATDSAAFRVETEMVLDQTDFHAPNNRAVYLQQFRDYYAYDDGSAEAGYGILGNGSANAQVAYRFENQLEGDWLWGIDLFFTRTLKAANLNYFYLMVWADKDGKPGQVLYRQPLTEDLAYAPGLGRFNSFRLHQTNSSTDTAVSVPRHFFVGWEQTIEGLLGVGLDRASDARAQLFYNVSSSWVPSQLDGALMLRPVFRKRQRPTNTQTPDTGAWASLSPNPASDYALVHVAAHSPQAQLAVFDTHGRLLHQQVLEPGDNTLALDRLPRGLLLLQLRSASQPPITLRLLHLP